MKNLLLFLMVVNAMFLQGQTISGELRKWHKIELSYDIGKTLTETDNTFRNNRLDVIFTSATGNSYRVPGFFAADGDAANSNADEGSIYKAILRPNETGVWKYELLFYEGNNVASLAVNNLPAPTTTLTGNVGNVRANNKSVPDLRAKGRLLPITTGTNNQKRYLRFSETGEYFLKIGPDSPENFLNYDEFDYEGGNNGRFEHSFAPHRSDFNTGDPTWDGGKGRGIIGSLNYLREQKMNSFSLSLFGGDDRKVVPWLNGSGDFSQNKFSYDISKLTQWEIVFDHAETQGLAMHLKFSESENSDVIINNVMRIYYREMVARFGHHLAIEWNISEEYGGPDAVIEGANDPLPKIDWLADIDPWSNHRVLHTYPNRHEKIYNYLLENNARLTGASIQTARRIEDGYDGKSGILTWINRSRENGTPWAVASDEQNPGGEGVFTSDAIDNKNVDASRARIHILWKTMIAGGIGVMWYGGSKGDFQTENFDRFGTLFDWSRIAVLDFFKRYNLKFWNMINRDNLVSGSANCLAAEGKTYIILLESGGTTNLNLNGRTGNYTIKWYDPRNGGDLQDGSKSTIAGGGNVSIGNPPANTGADWVALVTNEPISADPIVGTPVPVTPPAPPAPTPTPVTPPTPPASGSCDFDFQSVDNIVIIEAENIDVSSESWEIKTDRDGFSGAGFIEWLGNNSFGNPGRGTISAKIRINNPGKYEFRWRSRVGEGTNATESNDSWLRFPDASDFYAEKRDSRIYPNGVGKTPTPKGASSDGWFKIFLSGSTDWTWSSFTSDNDSHRVFVEFNEAGLYTMEISGRSKHHLIDRIILFQDGVSNPEGLGKEETICEGGVAGPPPTPTPTPDAGVCDSSQILNATTDFPNINIDGFSRAYLDDARNALAINAARFKDLYAAATTTFSGETGVYDLKLNTLAELDGESDYRISINGVTETEVFTNPKIFGTGQPDYTPASNVWENIALKNGDEIRVEFSSRTNGEIPEGDITAFSRGRWVSLEINCDADPLPDVLSVIDFGNGRNAITISVFPNPLKSGDSLLNISTDGDIDAQNVKVYTIGGQLVFDESSDSKITSIDLIGLEKGLYLVSIESFIGSKSKTIIKKIVKQ